MKNSKHRLTATHVKALPVGKHADGGGLYLIVDANGNRRWQFRYTFGAKRRELGLGGTARVSLATARQLAAEAAELLGRGLDPLEVRKDKDRQLEIQRAGQKTFGAFADEWFAKSVEPMLSNEKHVYQWKQTLGDAYCRSLRLVPIAQVGKADVLAVLQPIWMKRTETAVRLRGRIERVLDAAVALEARPPSANPARWRGHLDMLLPRPPKLTRGHHAAMPWSAIPDFMCQLADRDAVTAHALRFIILTASRTGEVLRMTWAEVDLANKVWTVPASRMKMKRAHRVPLSDAAVAVLEKVAPLSEGLDSELVFPGPTARPLGSEALESLRKRMGSGSYTTHGFRSAFRDWAGEATDAPREVAEGCLAHVVGNAVEQAYRRGDALEKRRKLLQLWADYCEPPRRGGEVVPFPEGNGSEQAQFEKIGQFSTLRNSA